MQLPKYKCHKEVRAAKITQVIVHDPPPGAKCEGGFLFYDQGRDLAGTIEVSAEYLDKHKPEIGGYYVLYEDGYESYSPAKAFEGGYTLISSDGPGDPLLQFFAYEHLTGALQSASKPFGELARQIVDTLPRNPERTVALRKLLEAKDCAVRALLFKAE